jgi:hypothetical protein
MPPSHLGGFFHSGISITQVIVRMNTTDKRLRRIQPMLLLAALLISACASGPPKVPYPAFIQVKDLDNVFLAGLPGVRARQFAGDARSARSSSLLQLPADWEFSTAAAPDKSVEVFVLAGQVELGGITLRPGGYAFLPPGSMGSSMRTRNGAELLYFLNDVNERATIRVPLITGIDSGTWQPLSDDPADFGLSIMEFRSDPGSGARTWLMRIDPVATQRWQSSSVDIEGFLVSGRYRHSECVDGKPVSAEYTSGGYFLRPAGAVNAGPDAKSLQTSIWLLRSPGPGARQIVSTCRTTE